MSLKNQFGLTVSDLARDMVFLLLWSMEPRTTFRRRAVGVAVGGRVLQREDACCRESMSINCFSGRIF